MTREDRAQGANQGEDERADYQMKSCRLTSVRNHAGILTNGYDKQNY